MRWVALVIAAFCCAGVSYAQQDDGSPAATVEAVPYLAQAIGDTPATLGPVKYPAFYAFQSDNPSCGTCLRTYLSGQRLDTSPSDGCSPAHPECCISCSSGNNASRAFGDGLTLSQRLEFQPVGGGVDPLRVSVTIPEEYRTTGRLLITWTVRVEGYKVDPYPVWTDNPATCLCYPWHGTSYQQFDSGSVLLALYYDAGSGWQLAGSPSIMTVPSAGSTSLYQPSDPTVSGSYLMTPELFNGQLPATLTLEVRWLNQTSMLIRSPANMRALMVTFLPISRE